MDTVNERTTLIVTVAFFNEDNVPVVPASAKYRLDDVTGGTAIATWQTISSLATSVDITITKGQNSIFGSGHPYETKRLTVEFKYGAGSSKQGTGEYIYRVKNLGGVEISASSSASASISLSPSASESASLSASASAS